MHGSPAEAVAFSPSGKTFATAAADGTVKLWMLVGGALIKTFDDFKQQLFCLSFSPDGKFLASGSGGKIIIWSVNNLKKVSEISMPGCLARSVKFSADGRYLEASCGNIIKLWEINHNDLISKLFGGGGLSFREKRALDFYAAVYTTAFSPDSQYIAAAGEGGLIKVWRAEDGYLLYTVQGHESIIWSLDFSNKGGLLASGGADRLVKIWDASTGRLKDTIAGQDDEVYCVIFSPDGTKLAVASKNAVLQVWTVSNGPGGVQVRNAVIISVMALLAALAGAWRASIRRINRLKVKNWKP
jgi:WD40 repeat protein